MEEQNFQRWDGLDGLTLPWVYMINLLLTMKSAYLSIRNQAIKSGSPLFMGN